MRTDALSNEEIVAHFRGDTDKLLKYLNWLEKKSGSCAYSTYDQEGISEHSIEFPVYDSTLMNFVREARDTCYMDRNYAYVYTRNRIKSVKDEHRCIRNATIRDMDKLAGILSRYVLGGQTKARLWSAGIEHGIYLAILKKCDELLNFWSRE
ncbi:MAG: hypothetical protein IJC59_05835 [Lachnospiraceae bacterium]|nr:hypothetical protein [Lachnospiraceae bacterium]